MKKIIAVIIAAIMLLSVPFNAGAALMSEYKKIFTPVPIDMSVKEATTTESPNMGFAKAIGIVSADKVGTDAVTRIEFAEMFCKIMRTDISLPGTQYIGFTDVPAEKAPIVANVSAVGLMNGVGGGLFAPDAPVTYIQAVKTMVSFLGYDQIANDKGGYPYGYLYVADSLDLLDGAPHDINETITVEDAVALFKLAINVDFRHPVSFSSDVKYEIEKNLSYLHYYRGIVRVRGVVRSTSVSDISGNGKTAYNRVRVGNDIFSFDNEEINFIPLLGHNVDIYVNLENDGIVFVEDVGTDVMEIPSTHMIGLDGYTIKYYSETDKVKKVKIDGYTRIVYNGTRVTNYTPADFNPYPGSAKDGFIRVIENNGDGVADVVMIEAYETYVVSKVVGNKIYAENITGDVLDLDAMAEYEEGETYLLYNIMGQPIRLEDIKEGYTITVTKDKEGRLTEIVVTIDTVKGILTQKGERDGRLYVTVNGQSFVCSNSVYNDPETAQLKLGNVALLSFNKDGLVSNIEQDEYDIWNIGYIVNYTGSRGLDPVYQVKIFGENGKFNILELDEEIYFNESTSAVGSDNILSVLGAEENGLIKRQPIMYKKTSDGKIKYIIHYDGVSSAPTYDVVPAGRTKYMYMFRVDKEPPYGNIVDCDGTNALRWLNDDGCFRGEAFISSSTILFNVPSEDNRNNDAEYGMYDIKRISNGDDLYIALYGIDPFPVADIGVVTSSVANVMHNGTAAFVVENIEEGINDDGFGVTYIIGMQAGAKVTYIDEEDVLATLHGGQMPRPGDILRVQTNADNVIRTVEYAFNVSTKKVYTSREEGVGNLPCDYGSNRNLFWGQARFTYGTVLYTDDFGFVLATTHANTGEDIQIYFPFADHKIMKVTNEARRIVVESANKTDLFGSEDYSTEVGSEVVVHTSGGYANAIIIYDGFQ